MSDLTGCNEQMFGIFTSYILGIINLITNISSIELND